MCCFPSYNNIGFQPQILKKAGVGFTSGAEAIRGVAVPSADRVSEQANYYRGVFFLTGGF